MVIAPTGYGKTCLLVDYANRSAQQVCWYTIDPKDNLLSGFARHFIVAIQQIFPQFGNPSLSALENLGDAAPDLDLLVTTLVNDLYQHTRQDFLFVLDDYHLVADHEEINRFVSRLIQRVDDNCHIVIAGRKPPLQLDLELLSSRSMVGILTAAELAFTPEEIQTLALQNYHVTLPDDLAKELIHETEGWITGLLLSASGKWTESATQIRAAKASGLNLYDYLARQVVGQQPAIIQDFLSYTALLGEFDLGLCQQILEPIAFAEGTEWARLIGVVQKENLFVVQVDEQDGWFRYQSLFSEFLQTHIEQKQPVIVERIRRRAGQVYVAQGKWEKAYAIYRQIADDVALADTIELAGSAMIKSGAYQTLAQWLEKIPAQIVDLRPGLISLKGAIALMSKDFHQALPFLNQAVDLLKQKRDDQLLARTLMRRAMAYHFTGNYQSALGDVDEALTIAEKYAEWLSLKADALSARGLNLLWLGKTDLAIEQLRLALAIYRQTGDEYNAANVLRDLGMAYRAYGSYAFARDAYQQSLAYGLRAGNLATVATLLNNLGVLYHYDGDYETAIRSFDEALEKARFSGYRRMEAYVLASIGDVYKDLEMWEPAQDVYQQSRQISQQFKQRSLLLYITLAEASLSWRQGDSSLALCLLEEAEKIAAQESSPYERCLCLVGFGRFYYASGQFDVARQVLMEAIQGFSNSHKPSDEARTHLYLFAVEHRSGNPERAAHYLKAALEIAAQIESQHTLVIPGYETRDILRIWAEKHQTGVPTARLWEQIKQFETRLPLLRRRIRSIHPGVTILRSKVVLRGFGEGRIYVNGKPIPDSAWEYPVGREILFYLATNPEGATKETLGSIFWADMAPEKLTVQSKNIIYCIRCAVGKEVILTQKDRYFFNHELDYTYDVELFDEIQRKIPGLSPEQQLKAYQEAVSLYKGGFLLAAGGDWVIPGRERFWLAYTDMIIKLAEHSLETREYRLSLNYCWHALQHEPAWEPAHRMAMRVYAAMGSRGDIIAQYKMCRQALEKTSGVPPSDETQQLYAILIQ